MIFPFCFFSLLDAVIPFSTSKCKPMLFFVRWEEASQFQLLSLQVLDFRGRAQMRAVWIAIKMSRSQVWDWGASKEKRGYRVTSSSLLLLLLLGSGMFCAIFSLLFMVAACKMGLNSDSSEVVQRCWGSCQRESYSSKLSFFALNSVHAKRDCLWYHKAGCSVDVLRFWIDWNRGTYERWRNWFAFGYSTAPGCRAGVGSQSAACCCWSTVDLVCTGWRMLLFAMKFYSNNYPKPFVFLSNLFIGRFVHMILKYMSWNRAGEKSLPQIKQIWTPGAGKTYSWRDCDIIKFLCLPIKCNEGLVAGLKFGKSLL